jgi:hypothetical protein
VQAGVSVREDWTQPSIITILPQHVPFKKLSLIINVASLTTTLTRSPGQIYLLMQELTLASGPYYTSWTSGADVQLTKWTGLASYTVAPVTYTDSPITSKSPASTGAVS